MTEQMKKLSALFLMTSFGLLAACGEPTSDDSDATNNNDAPPIVDEDEELPPLPSRESVIGDHPEENGETLPRLDAKFDLALPAKFDLVEQQSPVRNQGRRGVCSIFSTVGLMENLYIKAGDEDPDFSEQYLQWSAKVEVGGFPNTGGSSGRVNLDAITRFGIPEESAWPYEPSGWNSSDDEECDGGEDLPTKCYTNGDPPEEALEAQKFRLPRRDFVSSFPDSLKTYMFKNKRAVVTGMSFFYQAWNHGGTKLKVNQDNKRAGAVVFPSDADQEDSNERPAGHSILLVGWDDNKEFPRLDEDGEPLTDDEGNVIMDKGFFLFKNSWGTSGSWGSENEFGRGYGWLSYRYVQRWGRSVSAVEPELDVPMVEICGDNIDNDGMDGADCADPVCADEAACQPMNTTETFTSTPGLAIPDNDIDGVSDTLEVEMEGNIGSLKLTVDIKHSWSGDLSIILVGPNGDLAIVKEADSASTPDINETFVITEFDGILASGEWELIVSDEAQNDTGTIESWSLEITN